MPSRVGDWLFLSLYERWCLFACEGEDSRGARPAAHSLSDALMTGTIKRDTVKLNTHSMHNTIDIVIVSNFAVYIYVYQVKR